MRAFSDYDVRDPLSLVFKDKPFSAEPVGQIRIRYIPNFAGSPVDREIARSVADAVAAFSEQGNIVEEGETPFDLEPLNQAWAIIGQTGLAWLLESFPAWQGKIAPALEEMAKNGEKPKGSENCAALAAESRLRKNLGAFVWSMDAPLTPRAAHLPSVALGAFP